MVKYFRLDTRLDVSLVFHGVVMSGEIVAVSLCVCCVLLLLLLKAIIQVKCGKPVS